MKREHLKNLFGVLVICGLLTACGKDKAPAAPAPAVVTQTGYQPTVGTAVTSFEDFRQRVIRGEFTAVKGFQETYYYGKNTSESSKFLGFIPVTTNTWGNAFNVSLIGTTITGSEYGANETAIKAALKTIAEQASTAVNSFKQPNPGQPYFQFVSGNYIYGINLAYPAAANPVYRATISSGSYYLLYDVKSYSF